MDSSLIYPVGLLAGKKPPALTDRLELVQNPAQSPLGFRRNGFPRHRSPLCRHANSTRPGLIGIEEGKTELVVLRELDEIRP